MRCGSPPKIVQSTRWKKSSARQPAVTLVESAPPDQIAYGYGYAPADVIPATTLDFAKMMIDEGFHPMTMYFPLVVHGALLMEPTETESKETLDEFVGAMLAILKEARETPELVKRVGGFVKSLAEAVKSI